MVQPLKSPPERQEDEAAICQNAVSVAVRMPIVQGAPTAQLGHCHGVTAPVILMPPGMAMSVCARISSFEKKPGQREADDARVDAAKVAW